MRFIPQNTPARASWIAQSYNAETAAEIERMSAALLERLLGMARGSSDVNVVRAYMDYEQSRAVIEILTAKGEDPDDKQRNDDQHGDATQAP